jgi:sulfite exporter TauE/SafE
MTPFLSGVLLGLAGSVHCAGMCGPILLVLTGGAASVRRAAAIYHGSRISIYVLLAFLAGYAGAALTRGGLGRAVAVVAGTLLVLAAMGGLGTQKWIQPFSRAWSATVIRIGARAAAFTRRRPHAGYAVAGAVNGLLPCGLIYAAVGTAASSGSIAASALFMSGFGVGTVPALLGVTLAAGAVPVALRRRLRFVGPALMALAGLLLIGRALAPDSSVHHHPSVAVSASAR